MRFARGSASASSRPLSSVRMLWAFVSTKARPFLSGCGVSHHCAHEVRRDDVVSFCPPDTWVFREARLRGYLGSGLCEGGYEPLLKPIAAIEGDRVTRTEQGIRINGRLIANSKRLDHDGSGQALPSPGANNIIVAKGEVWVISSYNPLSFDSRYFGPVPVSKIEGLARPVFVMGPQRHP